jgi:hypothetical protein
MEFVSRAERHRLADLEKCLPLQIISLTWRTMDLEAGKPDEPKAPLHSNPSHKDRRNLLLNRYQKINTPPSYL